MHLRLILSLVILLGTSVAAKAQNVDDVPMEEMGDPQAGLEYARSTCAVCHGIEDQQSLNPKAPRFKDVANIPGMTPTALIVWLQGASHPRMPNIMFKGQELRNVVGLHPEPQAVSPYTHHQMDF